MYTTKDAVDFPTHKKHEELESEQKKWLDCLIISPYNGDMEDTATAEHGEYAIIAKKHRKMQQVK